jgi:hypothetical protein
LGFINGVCSAPPVTCFNLYDARLKSFDSQNSTSSKVEKVPSKNQTDGSRGHRRTCLALLVGAFLLQACGGSDGGPSQPKPPVTVERLFDFGQGSAGWISGSSDYSELTAPNDVIAELRSLPNPFTGTGYFQSGRNRSDDLFLYIKSPVDGLVPGVTYRLSANLQFLTQVPSGCVGVGGSPGESVWLVLAAASAEPRNQISEGDTRLSIDRGNQSKGGASGVVLGTMANTVKDCGEPRWESKTLSAPLTNRLSVKADEKGVIWVLIGFDSGFEALSQLYYQRLSLSLEPA